MSSITKVALAGATGNAGPAILDQLLHAGFHVTVLTRQGSSHSFPSSVTAIPVDYTSLDSLTSALKGQDAVVSTLAGTASDAQLLLIEAAVKAHVKRFIPSEFGADSLNAKAAAVPIFKGKVAAQDALKKEASSSDLTYTLVCTGPFLDWGISAGFVLSLKEKKATLFDGGNRPFSATSLPTVGKAVANVLKHPDQTKNRAVYVQDTVTTLQKLTAVAKKAVGAEGWHEDVVSTDDLLAEAWAELKKEQPNPGIFVYNFLKAVVWGEGYGSHFEKLDNKLLGIPELSDAELQSLVDRLAK